MIAKYLNWVLVASCAAFLMIGTYSSKLTKICVIVAVTAFVLLHLYENKKLFFKNLFEKTRLNKAIYLFLFVAVLSTIFGVSPYKSQQVLFNRYVIYFAVFFIGAFIGRKRFYVNILIGALLAGSVIFSIGCITDTIKAGHVVRMLTSFGSGVSGTYFLYTLPFFIGFIIFYPSLKIKIFSAIASMPVFIAFVFHGSRGVWLGLLAGVVATAFLINRRKRYLIGIILLLIIILYSTPFLRERVVIDKDFAASNTGSIDVRFQMWNSAVNIFKKYPLLGAGPGRYGSLMYDFNAGEIYGGRIHLHAHNTYVEVLADMGILGLLSFLWIFVLFFINSYKSIKDKPDFYKISFMMMLIAVTVHEFFMSVVLVGVSEPVIFWFLLGMGVASFGSHGKDLDSSVVLVRLRSPQGTPSE
jgi:putative inorganic carbon (hco3(-)) transporter